MTSTDPTRAAYIEGMRTLLDTLEKHPELPLPYQGNAIPMTFHFLGDDDPKAEMAAAARALPCKLTKSARLDDYFDMNGQLSGLKVQLTAFRKAVCERVVTATRQVEVEEKDPEALAAVPTVKKTVTVEDVEWRCTPLLAEAPEQPVAVS